MQKNSLQIALALSGGGIRAAIYHLGVLEFLAKHNLLEQVKHISSVSGGSMCMGLVYAKNGFSFPTSKQYLESVLPAAKEAILNTNIEKSAILRAVFGFKLFSKANAIAEALEKLWGINADFSKLPKSPLWTIQATNYHSGKRFCFSQEQIGDYAYGFVRDFSFPLSHAVAASAAFPFLIGALKVDSSRFSWCDSSNQSIIPPTQNLYLWDGGVYDNLGLGPLYVMENSGQYTQGVNFCIISNAGAPLAFVSQKGAFNLTRIVDVISDQTAILRLRSFRDFVRKNRNGFYITAGRDFESVVRRYKADLSLIDKHKAEFMSKEECQKVQNYPTTLKTPKLEDFERIFTQGSESLAYSNLCFPDFIEGL